MDRTLASSDAAGGVPVRPAACIRPEAHVRRQRADDPFRPSPASFRAMSLATLRMSDPFQCARTGCGMAQEEGSVWRVARPVRAIGRN
jgi:hypothetical protein